MDVITYGADAIGVRTFCGAEFDWSALADG